MAKVIKVKKKSGRLQEFNERKVIIACRKAGASIAVAKRVTNIISRKVYDGIPTSEIRKMVVKELANYSNNYSKDFKMYKKSKK